MGQQVVKFRELHNQSTPLILPNVWDAGGARLVESLGAKAVATTSAGVAWSLGYPDGDILPIEEQIALTKRMDRVLEIPFSVDVENGYSNDPAIVAKNVVAIAKAGASGINLEDGTDDPSVVIPKLKAIREALKKENLDLYVNLRTDVYLQQLVPADQAVEETIERGKAYQEAGADGLFVPALVATADIKAISGALSMPINVMSWGGLPAAEDLAKLGVKRLSAGSGVSQIIWKNIADLSNGYLANGDSTPFMTGYMAHGDLQGLFAKK